MRKKRAFFISGIFIFVLFFSMPIEAKTLPQITKSVSKNTVIRKKSSPVSGGVGISPKLRKDRKALRVYFSNLNKAKSITYTLIYQTDGKDEGVSGTVDTSGGKNVTRELLFGTCSSGVCRYHPNIKNLRFEATIEFASGKLLTKKYRIKV